MPRVYWRGLPTIVDGDGMDNGSTGKEQNRWETAQTGTERGLDWDGNYASAGGFLPYSPEADASVKKIASESVLAEVLGHASVDAGMQNHHLGGIGCEMPEVPKALRFKARWLKKEIEPVLKCYHRWSYLVFFGLIWTPATVLIFGPHYLGLIKAVMASGIFSRGDLSDDAMLLLMATAFMGCGIIVLLIGLYQIFVSTWITFKRDRLEIERGIFRWRKTLKYPLEDVFFNAESTSRSNNRTIYRIIIQNKRYKKKVTIIRGLDIEQATIMCDYLNGMIR